MAEYSFGRRLHDQKYFEVAIPCIHYKLEGTITENYRNKSITYDFIMFQTIFEQLRVHYIY